MWIQWEWNKSHVLLIAAILVLQALCKTWANTVYMDRFGDCFRGDVIQVTDEKYTILAMGGEAYDTLNCKMTFKSTKDDRLCVTFRTFMINRCDVKLSLFSAESSHGKNIGHYTCYTEDTPKPVCSEGRYLTVLMQKSELLHEGYDFNIELTEGDEFKEGMDAFIWSIGVIVSIIVGVIVIVILTAVVIVCCCCKHRQYGLVNRQSKKSTSCRTGVSEVPVEPSAPPLPADDPPPYFEAPPPYTSSASAPCAIEACEVTDEEKLQS